MPQTRRSMMTAVIAAFASLALTLGAAFAAELLGTVKSVDVDAKKVVVTEKDTDKDIDVTIKDDTRVGVGQGEEVRELRPRQAQEGRQAQDYQRGRQGVQGRDREGRRQEEGRRVIGL